MTQSSSQKTVRHTGQNLAAWKRGGIALALSLSMGACATDGTPDAGDRLSNRGKEIGSYGAAWTEGQNAVDKGEKIVEASNRSRTDGERALMEARNDVEKAEQKISDASATREEALRRISDGRAQMTQAESDYAVTKAGPSAVNPDY